jgi:predicted GNAT family acetyltransferase
MRALRFDDRDECLRRVEPFLMQHEAENCFFLGFVPRPESAAKMIYVAAEDARGAIVAVAFKSPGWHVMMTDAPDEAVDALVDHLLEKHVKLEGVQSRSHPARRFAARFSAATGMSDRRRAGHGVHKLTRVIAPAGTKGRLRPVREDEAMLLADWTTAFCRDCGMTPRAPAEELARARERIAREESFFWEVDGPPVSTATVHARTPNGIRISLVYTPRDLRGKGYASAGVAALSQRMLDAGRKFCFLYTDLDNPTSNKIYRAIGYEKVCEDEQIFFDSDDDSEAAPDAAAT